MNRFPPDEALSEIRTNRETVFANAQAAGAGDELGKGKEQHRESTTDTQKMERAIRCGTEERQGDGHGCKYKYAQPRLTVLGVELLKALSG